MAEVELTGTAVMERLSGEQVPVYNAPDGDLKYYLWAITDKQLHNHLDDAYYGQFQDNVDYLNSVTMPPYRKQGLWVFAPNSGLIDWFVDHVSDVSQIKFAIVRLSDVEEALDENDYPRLSQLTHPDSKRLYAYPVQDLLNLMNLLKIQFEAGKTETEALEAVDEKFQRQQNTAIVMSEGVSGMTMTPVKLSDDDDEDDDEFEYDSSLSDDGTSFDEPMFGEEGFDDGPVNEEDVFGFVDEPVTSVSDPDPFFGDDAMESGAEINSESEAIVETKPEIPASLQHKLAELNVAVMATPSIQSDDDSPEYREKMVNLRTSLNEQLENLQENAKHQVMSKYFELRDAEAAKIDAQLDPQSNNVIPQVKVAYERIEKLNHADEADAREEVKQFREKTESQLSDAHDQFIQEAITKAEEEWRQRGQSDFVEGPVNAHREELQATVSAQINARMSRFKEWVDEIKNRNMVSVDARLIKQVSPLVTELATKLQAEQAEARRAYERSEERLFAQELQRQQLMREPVTVLPELAPTVGKEEDELPELEVTDEMASADIQDEPLDEELEDEPEIGFESLDEETLPDLEEEPDEELDADTSLEELLTEDGQVVSEDNILGTSDFNEEPETDGNMTNLSLDDFDLDDGLDLDDSPSNQDEDLLDDVTLDDDLDLDLGLPDDPISDTPVDEVEVDDIDFDEDTPIEDLIEEEDEESESSADFKPIKSKKKSKLKSKKKVSSGETDKKFNKKLGIIVGGASAVVIVVIIAVVMLFGHGSGGGDVVVSPSATGTYTAGQLVAGKRGGKPVSLSIKKVDGNKLTVTDVQTNDTFVVTVPKK